MNERIRELAEQAKEHANHLDSIGVDASMGDIFNQKFAQLIVAECAAEADKCAERGSWMAGYRIKLHFGVEE